MSADHRRCSICGTGVPAGVLCVDHAMLTILARHISTGIVSDWPPPPPPLPLQVTHRDFMTGPYQTHPSYTWRAQLAALLAHHNIILDDSGRE